jgi:FkbM family methyltransferase
MKYKDHIFDIGAFDGLDGLILALKNKNMMVHVFEANPFLIKNIRKNKKKIEDFKKIKIKNYKINNFAVSNKNKFFTFNIAKNPTVSSLYKFSKNIEKTWPGYREAHCTFIKKVKVKGITLEKYCKDKKIERINYLHIDTQGNDLNVLKGLNKKIEIVERGVLEAAINKKKALYQNINTMNEILSFLKKNEFLISKIESVNENIHNEKNVFFYSKRIKYKDKVNSKYNLRSLSRVISGKVYLKDKIFNKIENLIYRFNI